MTSLYSLLLLFLSVGLLFWGFSRNGGIYEFPFLSGVVLFLFVWFQSIGLYGDPNLPTGAVDRVLLMSVLCGGAVWAGYVWVDRPLQIMDWQYDKERLLWVAVGFVVVGQFFYYWISTLPSEMTEQSQWSGLPVALLFFASVRTYGIVIALLHYSITKSKVALFVGATGLFMKIIGAIGYGDRSGLILLFFMVALPFWFVEGKRVPKYIAITLIVVGTFFSYSVSEYRSIENLEISKLSAISFVQNVEKTIDKGGQEIRAAAYQMAAIKREGDYDYGVYQWNRFVFNYVPAQIVGNNFKNSLFIEVRGKRYRSPSDRNEIVREQFGFFKTPGLAVTGMATSFGSLWYFGFALFLLVGYIMGKLYISSLQGNLFAQICYTVTIVAGLESFTHMTSWFFMKWPHIFIFLVPALMWAQLTRREEKARHVKSNREMEQSVAT